MAKERLNTVSTKVFSSFFPSITRACMERRYQCLQVFWRGMIFEYPLESYGKNAERIQEDDVELESTRPDSVQADLRQLFESVGREDLQQARDQIAHLHDAIGNDPELGKAEVLIRRRGAIGR
jgi:hypothetical protein